MSGFAIFTALLGTLCVFHGIENGTFNWINVLNLISVFWMIQIAVKSWKKTV
jgi:hypothetical protein